MPTTSTKGRFFVLEGANASGKTTQLHLLAKRLMQAGYDVVTFDFPQYAQDSSYFVRRYLSGDYGSATQVGPYTASLFYALDRFSAKKAIASAVQEGKIVLSNRYTGSSMAHQGMLFSRPEERRGFYTWLDNLEFKMLNLPRPNLNIILRVDYSTTSELLAKRQSENPTREADLHESDTEHMKRSIEAYDDISSLFPREFTRVDCVRGGQLLDAEYIHEIMWHMIQAELPAATRKTGSIVDGSQVHTVQKTPTQSSHENSQQEYSVSYAAYLHLVQLGLVNPQSDVTSNSTRDFYVPEELSPDDKVLFRESINAINQAYDALHASLKGYISLHDQTDLQTAGDKATAVLMGCTPYATKVSVHFDLSTVNITDKITALLSHEFPELQSIGQDLFRRYRSLFQINQEQSLRDTGMGARIKRSKDYQKLIDSVVNRSHGAEKKPVELVSYSPRNELDLVPYILYGQSTMSFKGAQKHPDSLSYDEKANIIQSCTVANKAYCHETLTAKYTFDLLCSASDILRMMQSIAPSDISLQENTIRYGFTIPKLVEEAGIADAYEAVFDASAGLYNTLMKAGSDHISAYAVLLGHKNCFLYTVTNSALQEYADSSESDSTSLADEILDLARSVHQLLLAE